MKKGGSSNGSITDYASCMEACRAQGSGDEKECVKECNSRGFFNSTSGGKKNQKGGGSEFISHCFTDPYKCKTAQQNEYSQGNMMVHECKPDGNGQYCYNVEYSYADGGKSKKIRKGSLETYTVAQLKEKCVKKGIKHSGLKKAQLIAALRKK